MCWRMATRQILRSILESKDETKRIVKLFGEHKDNSKWISMNLTVLRKRFPNKYIAVRDRQVVKSDENLKRLITQLKKEFADIDDITIEQITDKPIKLLL